MVNMNKVKATIFETTLVHHNGDGISGVLCIIYFQNMLRNLRKTLNKQCPSKNTLLSQQNPPLETTYADDFNFITTDEKRNKKI